MTDPRYNDISRQLRIMANALEKTAKDHRLLANKLDAITAPDTATTAPDCPAWLRDLDAAALQLVDLPAAEIRAAAPLVARQSGQQVLPVALRAQHLRASRKAIKRRAQTVELLKLLAHGATLPVAAGKLGVSVTTATRLRNAWRDQ